MERLILERVGLPDRTLGSLIHNDQVIAKTLELPWLENKRSVSCIPAGIYIVIKQLPKEGRPYEYFRLPNVPGRSGILIHRGTNPLHSKGCILVASRFKNINTEFPELEERSKKLQWLIDTLPQEWELEIRYKTV